MVLRGTLDFAVRRSALLLPAVAAGAGAGYALDGLAPAMAGGAAIAFVPAAGIGLALELRGHSLRSADDVRHRAGLETLGAIGRFHQAPGSAFPTEENSEALEAYRELARSLRAHTGHESCAVLVTSAGPEEGKSTTAANLATALAQLGPRVVLVDGDLRWSSLRSTIANASSQGLSGLLLNSVHLPQLAVVRTNERNLFLLPAGELPRHPQELLALPRLAEVVASLKEMADYVIIDSPPVLEADDAQLVARIADATVLVMHARKTRSREVRRALRVLSKIGVKPLGAILNQAPFPQPDLEPEPARAPAAGALSSGQGELDAAAREERLREARRALFLPERRTSEPDPASSPSSAVLGGASSTGRQASVPNLRLVSADERPESEPLAEPAHRAEFLEGSPPTEAPVVVPAYLASAGPSRELVAGDAVGTLTEGELSLEEMLAHMEETLRLIQAMRREKSSANL